MRRRNKSRRNRYGASSVFLGIVLSAAILVECTFLTFVWELDYITKVNNAVETQVESILCEYNRQLFDVYGIYAFTINVVDDDVYRKALLNCGYSEGPKLDIGGYRSIDKKALRDAINMYYSYRGSGIAIIRIADFFSEMISELADNKVLKMIKEFTSSPAAGYVSDIIRGSEKLSGWLEKAGTVLEIEDADSYLKLFESLKKELNDDNDLKDLGFDIRIDNMKPVLEFIDRLMQLHESVGKTENKLLSHVNTANYLSFNFDCYLKQDIDSTINGTAFSDIHKKNKCDTEYILTGKTDTMANVGVAFLLMAVLSCKNFLIDYLNKDYRTKIDVISTILSVIIAAVSEGTVQIDYRIITVVLIHMIACIKSVKEIKKLKNGDRVTLMKIKSKNVITAGYRDFLFLFMLGVPDNKMLERALVVLKRDYGDLYTGFTASADAGIKKIEVTRSYALYG